MKLLTLEERKQMSLDILISIDKFCKKENLKYFITGGTLLGAVRHKGFIPWDDDIDIFMPRSDYEKFIHIYKDDNSHYKVLSYETSDWYFYPFAKVINTDTSLVANDFSYKEMGIFVDIFPLESLCGDYEEIKKGAEKIKKLRNQLYYMNMKYSFFNKPSKKIALFLFKATHFYLSSKKTNNAIKAICKKLHDDNPTYVASLTTMTYGEKEIMNASFYKNTTQLLFEGYYFNAPEGYKDVLTNFYKNYMELPPVDKRVPHEQTAYIKE